MQVLRQGSKGVQVQVLQGLLNKANIQDGVSGNALVTDGQFGPLTASALYAFQSRRRLNPDKVAGFQTWRELGLQIEKEHNSIRLFAQYSSTSCWAAAAQMLLKSNLSCLNISEAQLDEKGRLLNTVNNFRDFAEMVGCTALNYSPSVQELVSIVKRTPVWIAISYKAHFTHCVVLSAVYSDMDEKGDGTIFRLHDPAPLGSGSIYGSAANPITLSYDFGGYEVRLLQVIVPR
ncbi:MAG: peptidoglycan-binding protein [Burkholderiaceae bacterium]|nr:peptidoglycan-binding protein [Burkholderiaceae bacterium]